MKKVIPKRKIAFPTKPFKVDSFNFDHTGPFQFVSYNTNIGIAGENIQTGDMVVVREDGTIVPFKGPEG